MDRRRFLEITLATGASTAASRFFGSETQSSSVRDAVATARYEIADWIAATSATFYRPYRSKPAKSADALAWVSG